MGLCPEDCRTPYAIQLPRATKANPNIPFRIDQLATSALALNRSWPQMEEFEKIVPCHVEFADDCDSLLVAEFADETDMLLKL